MNLISFNEIVKVFNTFEIGFEFSRDALFNKIFDINVYYGNKQPIHSFINGALIKRSIKKKTNEIYIKIKDYSSNYEKLFKWNFLRHIINIKISFDDTFTADDMFYHTINEMKESNQPVDESYYPAIKSTISSFLYYSNSKKYILKGDRENGYIQYKKLKNIPIKLSKSDKKESSETDTPIENQSQTIDIDDKKEFSETDTPIENQSQTIDIDDSIKNDNIDSTQFVESVIEIIGNLKTDIISSHKTIERNKQYISELTNKFGVLNHDLKQHIDENIVLKEHNRNLQDNQLQLSQKISSESCKDNILSRLQTEVTNLTQKILELENIEEQLNKENINLKNQNKLLVEKEKGKGKKSKPVIDLHELIAFRNDLKSNKLYKY
jgi:hypothetical protein